MRSKMRRQHATIKEVAEHAKVSQMTVSRVLNRRETVRESTRVRVEEAIAALNYRPNLLARSLAGGRALFIGLIFNNPSASYLGEFLVGALGQCRKDGHHLVLEDSRGEGGLLSPEALIDRVANAGLDGVILVPPLSENPIYAEQLRKLGLAVVSVAPSRVAADDLAVSVEDNEAAALITGHLQSLGHRHIGCIQGPLDHFSARQRLAGFMAAMKAANLPVRDEWMLKGDYNYRSGMDAAAAILRRSDRPTAIFASNDDMAAGAIACAYRMGLRVPEDLSIVGFDDTPIADGIWPQLTTIRQPIAAMASASVELLTKALSGSISGTTDKNADPENKGRHVVLDVTLVERGSVRAIEA